MGFTSNRQVACEILSSSVCNASCKYCFLPKVESLKNFLPRIKDKIVTRKYIDELVGLYGDKLTHIALWGTEPLTTLDDWGEITKEIVEKFPKLSSVGFSTNMFKSPAIIMDYINFLPKDKDDFSFNIQISVDGPPEITDNNRGNGATNKITSHFCELLMMLNKMDLGKLKIRFSLKPTIDIKNIEWFLDSISRLYGYFFFFDILIDNAKRINKNKNVFLDLYPTPSLAVPGFYTSADGHKLGLFFEYLSSIESENNQRSIFRHIHGGLNTYEERLMRFMRFSSEAELKPSMFTCSGGDSNFQLDCDGNVHICHRTLFYESKEFVEALVGNDKEHGREESVSKGMIKNVSKNWIVNSNDQGEIDRFLYSTGNYHNWGYSVNHLSLGVIYELASCNQISKIFLDERMAYLFSSFINSALSCPAENLLNNGSLYLTPLSCYRMFGNGAFQQLVNKVSARLNKEYVL